MTETTKDAEELVNRIELAWFAKHMPTLKQAATPLIQSALTAARAEGERIGFERGKSAAIKAILQKAQNHADENGRHDGEDNSFVYNNARASDVGETYDECEQAILAITAPSPASKPEGK